mgnify:FL=1
MDWRIAVIVITAWLVVFSATAYVSLHFIIKFW